jgi:protein involved in polysaccharide export with SLBB domain
MEPMKSFGRGMAGLGLLLAGIFLAGCQTDDTYKFDPVAPGTAPAAPAAAAPTSNGVPAFLLSGTNTSSSSSSSDMSGMLLQVGDKIAVAFSDTPSTIPAIGDTIKDDGSITLIYNQQFQAAGRTIGALQADVRDRYVPQYFKYLTVTITPDSRFYSIGGEVRAPSRQVYSGKMTVLRAIDTAGGFTDFARKTRVQVTRASGDTVTVNCVKALSQPDLDVEIYPGDKVFVPKRIW